MSHIPLNGPEPIRAVERALTGAGFTRTEPVLPLLKQVFEPTRTTQTTTTEAPGDTGTRDLAVDPTQGHGSNHRPDPDPLVAALRQLPSMTGYF